jgi:hypothetical protein
MSKDHFRPIQKLWLNSELITKYRTADPAKTGLDFKDKKKYVITYPNSTF